MRAASLLLVFVLAKAAVLIGHNPPLSLWALAACLWQDLLIALVFAGLDAVAHRIGLPGRFCWAAYWIIAVYTAVNIPIARVLFTPLTVPMLRAARGPLADSVPLYLTWANLLLVLVTVGAAALFPALLRRVSGRALLLAATGVLPVAALGPVASFQLEPLGLERNVVVALITSARPRVHPQPAAGDWRTSRFRHDPQEDLSRFRGIAAGRNVILVRLESTAAQYLSLYGGQYDVMPNLSRLARNALVFEAAYAVYPESTKGLFSVLCSISPAFDTKPGAYENVPCRSVAAVLGDSGYCTALFHSGRFADLEMQSVVGNRGFETLEDAGDSGGEDEPSTVRSILSWIDMLPPQQRFVVAYLPIAGHHPYETPERGPFPEHDEMGRYRNALHYGDASLGTLVEGLRDRGLLDTTLWIIFGNHGEAFGQHEGNYGHTFFLYEENVRVPFVIAAPGLISGQVRIRKVVSLVDTAPTVLDLLGIPDPGMYHGRSMLDDKPTMALFFADYSLGTLGLRDGSWKFIYEIESGRSKMFHLGRDPHERTNLSALQSERAAWYTRVVRGWSAAQKSFVARWQ